MENRRLHVVAAFTLTLLVIGWGVLLSPGLERVRVMLGLPAHLEGSRYNPVVGAAELVPSNPELFVARTVHYYHALFACLLYSMLVLASLVYPRRVDSNVLVLALVASLFTVFGGIGYAYVKPLFSLHGVFIAGLAFLYAAGLLVVFKGFPRDPVEAALWVIAILLLVGGTIGGYVGSVHMDEEKSRELFEAVVAARIDPDQAEHVEAWRARTAHEHAMVALVLAATLLLVYRVLGGRMGRGLSAVYAGSASLTALGSYAVWFLGEKAHVVITPSSLILVFTALLLALKAYRIHRRPVELKGVVSLGLVLGIVAIIGGVVATGAIIAVSLDKPTRFISPEFRDPSWDWSELAFNIGHWHVLVAAWGTALLLGLLAYQPDTKLLRIAAWLTLVGFLVYTVGQAVYSFPRVPQPYHPNPFKDPIVKYVIEPGIAVQGIGIALAYLATLLNVAKRRL